MYNSKAGIERYTEFVSETWTLEREQFARLSGSPSIYIIYPFEKVINDVDQVVVSQTAYSDRKFRRNYIKLRGCTIPPKCLKQKDLDCEIDGVLVRTQTLTCLIIDCYPRIYLYIWNIMDKIYK